MNLIQRFIGDKMLRQIIENFGYKYVEVDPESEEKILKLFSHNILYEPMNGDEFLYLGAYHNIRKNSEQAEVCYEQSASLGNSHGLNNLAVIYETKYKDYEKAEIYYKKAVQLDNYSAMSNLAYFYELRRQDFVQAEIYYKMAFKHDKNSLISFYTKQNRHEEAFLLAADACHEKLNTTLAQLKYPISEQNRDKIYAALETLEPSHGLKIGLDVFYIMQDVIGRKTKILCEIAYHYKKYNFYVQN